MRFAILFAAVLAGCAAPVPECAVPAIGILETAAGRLYVFDEENFALEAARMYAAAAGRCRLRSREKGAL